MSVMYDSHTLYDIKNTSVWTENYITQVLKVSNTADLSNESNASIVSNSSSQSESPAEILVQSKIEVTLGYMPENVISDMESIDKKQESKNTEEIIYNANPNLKPSELKPIAGNNLKNITVLLSMPENQLSHALEFLNKMLHPLGIRQEDLFVFNLNTTYLINLQDFQHNFGTQVLLCFGVGSVRFANLEFVGINKIYVHKSEINTKQILIVFMQKLELIAKLPNDEKRVVWNELKRLFSIKPS